MRAIVETAPDIVTTLNGRLIGYNYALARAARETGVDFIYRMAGNDIATRTVILEAEGRPVSGTGFCANLQAQEQYAAEVARSVIVMGATEAERVRAMVCDPGKIKLCRRGVDRDHFSPCPTPAERCDSILFVGRNSAEKGIDLIEAAADILAVERPKMRFTIAGDFKARKVGNRHYLGFHDYAALPDLYRDHQIFLLPARSEGFPQVVMEAMSCGLPAILTRRLFWKDLDGESGVSLVEPEPRDLVDALLHWHDDPERFQTARSQALDHAAEHFDANKNAAHYRRAVLGDEG